MNSEDFVRLFNLPEGSRVDRANIKVFKNIVIGSYLLHREIMQRGGKKIPTRFFDGRKMWLSRYPEGHSSWRDHIMGIGSFPIIWVAFGEDKNSNDSTPFWTYYRGMENVKHDINMAYTLWNVEFIKINAKYLAKYGVTMSVELDKYMSTNRWFFRTRSIKIHMPLTYRDKSSNYRVISEYEISRVISQQSNVWLGRQPQEITDIINEYNDKIKK